MEIILHVHHANVSLGMRARAERAVRKIANRLAGVVNAIVRFEGDGAERRVELELHTTRRRTLVVEGRGGYFSRAFAQAMTRLEREVREAHTKAVRDRRALRRAKAA